MANEGLFQPILKSTASFFDYIIQNKTTKQHSDMFRYIYSHFLFLSFILQEVNSWRCC